MKDIHVGKNVGLKLQNLVLVQQYMFKTKRNFSKTLNIIIEEWDKFSIEIERLKRETDLKKLDEFNEAKVVK